MKKMTLIAAAVAMAASGTAMAGSHGGSSVKVSGIVQMQYKTSDAPTVISGGDVRLNFAATSALGNGTSAFANYRIDADGVNGQVLQNDATKVGLKGSWGTLTMGNISQGTAYTEVAGDFNGDPTSGMKAAISYSKSMGDISFTVGMAPEGSGDETTVGVKWASGAYSVAAGTSDRSGGTKDSLIAATAKFGDIGLAIMTGDIKDEKAMKFKVSYASGKISAAFTSAMIEAGNGATDSTDTRIDIAYKLGGGASVSYRNHNDDDNDAGDYSRIMLSYKF